MRDDYIEGCLIQLRLALQQAAMPADRQIARFKGFDAPYEVADDFDNWCRWALAWEEAALTEEQRSRLAAMNERLEGMSGERNAKLWTDHALRSRPEWEAVRRDAREILELFNWPIEDEGDPGIKVVRV